MRERDREREKEREKKREKAKENILKSDYFLRRRERK